MEKRDWIIELTEELKNEAEVSTDEPERWKKRSIYKIPVHAANLNKEAYAPWVVAIGPYHHKDEQLQRMEEHKKRALRHFLRRSNKPLARYVDALAEVVHDLMDAYEHLEEAWKHDAKRFLQLMIVDGCFVLEAMRAEDKKRNDYAPNDLIFSYHGTYNAPCIRRDMLLLENQVPLLVLERLLDVENGSIQVSLSQPSITKKPNINEGTAHSATEMKQAGIKFERGSSERLKDISFKGRILRLPAISLDDTSESTYLNMVAYERFHVGAGNEISSYIYFMSRLICDVSDVHLLQSHHIIFNAMSSDDDVRKLFLTLSKEIVLDFDEVYININEELRSHFKKTLFSWQYHLNHIFFRSPWTLVSVIAAALGLGLLIAQVVYAVC